MAHFDQLLSWCSKSFNQGFINTPLTVQKRKTSTCSQVSSREVSKIFVNEKQDHCNEREVSSRRLKFSAALSSIAEFGVQSEID